MDEILLSVVIPTYNRYKYLKGCLEATTKIESSQMEIIVQDNTLDNHEILQFISDLNDNRIKYYHIADHISVDKNCDFGIKHAIGKYVCMIGDDDTICASMIEAAAFCDRNKIDSCNFIFPGFNWPDMTFIKKKKEANLFYKIKADGSVKIINPYKELYYAICKAEGLSDRMPKVYHGIVSKECLDRVLKKAGTYFPGPSPDMANAVAVCLESKRAIFIKDYLMVSGYGYDSARGQGNRQQHYGKLTNMPWLPKDILQRWDKNLPEIFSGETITAQSLIESLKRMGRKNLSAKYNYSSFYAIFLYHHRDAFPEMFQFCIKKPQRFVMLMVGTIERLMAIIGYQLKKEKITYLKEIQEVDNLIAAQEYTDQMRKDITEYKWIND